MNSFHQIVTEQVAETDNLRSADEIAISYVTLLVKLGNRVDQSILNDFNPYITDGVWEFLLLKLPELRTSLLLQEQNEQLNKIMQVQPRHAHPKTH